VDSQSIVRTSVASRLLVPGLLLLAIQITLQYQSLRVAVLYPAMATIWLGLTLLFRSEIMDASRRMLSGRARARSRRSSSGVGLL
jgi:hypothetical protein